MARTDSPLRGRMIFVVGARRSGTNWLQRLLAAHPDAIAVPSETYLFSMGIEPLRERLHQGAARSSRTGFVYMDRDAMIDTLRGVCDAVFDGLLRALDPSAVKLIERTPDHVRHLGLIGELYPDAPIVHIIRDGRDVVRSLLSQDWGPDEPRLAAEEWRTAIESARAAAAGNPNYHEVRYEQLLENTEAMIGPLFNSVGLSSDEKAVASAVAEGAVPFNVDRASPRIATAKWQTELGPEVLNTIEEVAGDLLIDLGYSPAPKHGIVTTAIKSAKRRKGRARVIRGSFGRRPLDVALESLDAFLEAAANDPDRIRPQLSNGLRVRIVTIDHRYEGRGDEAVERLIETIRADVAMTKPQASGYVHPGTPTITFVGQFDVDGRREPRIVVLTVGNEMIEQVAFYNLGSS